MEDTLFTKIIKGEIPSHKVYEDDSTYAFLTIHPHTEGHVLVVPKKQVDAIWDLPAQDYQALMASVQKIGVHIREVLEAPRVGVLVEGLEVPHAHVHLIPIIKGDEVRVVPDTTKEPDHVALAAVAEKLRF